MNLYYGDMMKNKKTQFRKVPVDQNKRGLKKTFGMVQSFAVALASRGVNNKKVNKPIKQLRVLSCFGNESVGGELPPCEYLEQSKIDPTKYICGGCGCGDREQTFLVPKADAYGKLDYPKVACPLQMPGFTNYIVSTPDEADEPVTRKYYIENIDYDNLQDLNVAIGEQENSDEDIERHQEPQSQKTRTQSQKTRKQTENK